MDEEKGPRPNENEFLDEDPDISTEFFDYLKSEPGHKLAERIVTLFEAVKTSTLDKNADLTAKNAEYVHKTHKRFQIIQATVYVLVILISAVLAYVDKFTPALGLLFGTIIGYFFGKRSSE